MILQRLAEWRGFMQAQGVFYQELYGLFYFKFENAKELYGKCLLSSRTQSPMLLYTLEIMVE